MGGAETGERQRDAKRKWAASSQKAARDIPIDDPRDWELRVKLERSIYNWLKHYFADLFYNEFNPQQRKMIQAVLHAAKHGGDQAIAAPRGEGKTSIAECVVSYCILTGRLKFPLIVAATGPDAQNILGNIKRHFDANQEIREQYPEVCCPIWALEGASQRANMQTCLGGHRTRLKWGVDRIIFPDVPEYRTEDGRKIKTKCAGTVLMTRGLDSAIRGIRLDANRPDLVLIDDPETRESVESDGQITKRRRSIEQDIGGLGGPGKRMARLMLCTIMNKKGIAYEYTDPQQHPSWCGVRYKMLVNRPDREDLWDEYVELRRSAMASAQINGKSVADAVNEANQFYLSRRKEMDAGATVANPARYDAETEYSALQRCYNIIADNGIDAFRTEYQNDPPEQAGPQESGIYAGLVASRLSGLDRGVVPIGCNVLTAAIDCSKVALHWCVQAWNKQAYGSVIDYGVQDVWPKNRDNDKAVELAILQALFAVRDQMLAAEYMNPDGELFQIRTCLIDSGNWERPAYELVRTAGGAVFKASKGMGENAPGRRSYFRAPEKETDGKKVGEHCFASYQSTAGLWLFGLDTNYWKSWLHQRFMTPEDQPGSLTIFGNDKRDHISFAHHICAEVEVEEFVEGKGLKRYWKKVSPNNHWLDTSYMAACAASMNGVQLVSAPSIEQVKAYRRPTRKKPSAKPLLSRPGGWIKGMQ